MEFYQVGQVGASFGLFYGVCVLCCVVLSAQSLPNPLIQEYTLNHIRDPIVI